MASGGQEKDTDDAPVSFFYSCGSQPTSPPRQFEMEESKREPLDGDEMLDLWDRKVHSDRLKLKYSGFYYRFEGEGQLVSEGTDDLDGNPADITADTPCILTSQSKLFLGAAVMRTMHLRPDDWYPEKGMHEFPGWEAWRDFAVYENKDTAGTGRRTAEKVTVHQLLTHTSGWPFGLQGTREKILNIPLYFEPGTQFGYSVGHRLLGWMLLDYWKAQPEGAQLKSMNDMFKFLVYDPLGMTGTSFIKSMFEHPHSIMGDYFAMKFFDNPRYDDEDDPADLGMASTGHDVNKLTMMAFRRGKLADGSTYIEKWDEWAATNHLPGNKFSQALTTWRMQACEDCNFVHRIALTRTTNAGAYGWSYYGATYHDTVSKDHTGDVGVVTAVGWKGFSSCASRADYAQRMTVVVMQENMADPGSRNVSEVIHYGRVGKYNFGDVARKLAATDQEALEAKRKGYGKPCCTCCHAACAKTTSMNPLYCPVRCVLRSGYCLLLPIVARTLKFHHREHLTHKSLTAAKGSAAVAG